MIQTKMKIKVTVDHQVDLITNSSSEIFVVRREFEEEAKKIEGLDYEIHWGEFKDINEFELISEIQDLISHVKNNSEGKGEIAIENLTCGNEYSLLNYGYKPWNLYKEDLRKLSRILNLSEDRVIEIFFKDGKLDNWWETIESEDEGDLGDKIFTNRDHKIEVINALSVVYKYTRLFLYEEVSNDKVNTFYGLFEN